MSDDPYKPKTLGDHIEQQYWGENGVRTGTLSNLTGYETYERKKADSLTRTSSDSSGTNSKVICSELHRQDRMSRADLMLGARYFREELSERHMRGYHVWAIRAVLGMRKSGFQTELWRRLAQARADAIAAHYGEHARGNVVKTAVLHGFNALCWCAGAFAKEQNWQRLYPSRSAI